MERRGLRAAIMTGGPCIQWHSLLVGEITAGATYDVLGAGWNLMFAR
jgi:hypothetical protein